LHQREGGRQGGETREKVAAARLWLPLPFAFSFAFAFAFAAEKEGEEEEAWRGGGHVPGERIL
jgi:hypothetical protein